MSADALPSTQQRLLLEKFLSGAAHRRAPEISRRRPGDPVPLSAEQKDVWLHAAMAPEVTLYNESITIHRRGAFDRSALERSLHELLRRHESWRTSFGTVDGELRQVVHSELQLDIPFVDISHLSGDARERKAVALATRDARRPFELSRPPLLRARIVRLAPDNHRLYLTLHHIIFDGVSIYRIVLPELTKLYEAFAAGREPDVAPPRLQYGDYAIWRERELARDELRRGLAYWRENLSGELPVLRLPVDRARPAQPTYRGSMECFALSGRLTDAVTRLARNEGTTVYVVLLAAFKAMLHRYSGQEDIIIGGVTDMRRRPELAGTVGYFLNSMALRTRPRGSLAFRDYLRDVQNTMVDALDASGVPFDRVVRDVRPKREPGAHPIFQVLFSIEPPPPALGADWDLTQMDVTVGASKFDLYLELDERPDGIIGRFLYSTELFDAATIRRMIGHWTTLLEGAVADPQTELARLPLLTQGEKRELLDARNATQREYPAIGVAERFEAAARRAPEAIAVQCEGQQWRYRELAERVAQRAAQLRRAGIGRESLVAILLERNFEMVAGLLAILRAGAAYLPLDPQLPPARLAMFVREAKPQAVLTQMSLRNVLPATDAKTILVDGPDETATSDIREYEHSGRGDELAYLLFTSGSTGKPKAVEICGRALTNLLFAMEEEIRFSAADTLLAVTTLSFDIAALELFLPLVTGATLLLATRETAMDPARLLRLLEQPFITVMQATPATWRALIAAGWRGRKGLRILCGGEALPCELARQLAARCDQVWNVYGPTETTIWSLIHKVDPGDSSVPIGRPLANTSVYVLDRNDEPVPVGVPGELLIGGAGLARGYRGDTALTSQKFCGCDRVGAARLYRTGDTVRFRADGTLEFLGRTDNQVKVRGFRVALEEIETAIAAHPDAAAAAVRASEDSSGATSLTAFVVPRNGENGAADIADFVAQTLPRYMLPSRFVTVPALPLTANGKLDRAKLPAAPPVVQQAAAGPRDEFEAAIADIWKRLLGQDSIGIHDNFFEAGGHSLLAAMLAAEIRKFTEREVSLAALFRAPTIAAQADLLREGGDTNFSHLVLLREGAGRPFFLVHGVFGNVLQFGGLAAQLRTARPIYGVQARGADLELAPHATIAEMAAAYLDEIRRTQPTGPYTIGGYSFGGLVAYEIACRLVDAGEQLDLLALLTTDVCYRNLRASEWLANGVSLPGRLARKLRLIPARRWPRLVLGKLGRLCLGLEGIPFLPSESALPERVRVRNRELYRLGVREYLAYRPRPFAGRISVFHTAEPALDTCDPLPLWRRLATAVDVYTVGGAHGTIMEEANVADLALALGQCLARADASLPVPASGRAIAPAHTVCNRQERDVFAEPDFAH